jgi:hypothetical protein
MIGMEKLANNLKELCNLFPDKLFYYKHKDGRIGFTEGKQMHWYIYDYGINGFVDKGFSKDPQMAKLMKTPSNNKEDSS